MQDQYKTIGKQGLGDYREKGSKFFGYSYCVNNTDDVEKALEEIKSIHPKARHICYAYKIGITDDNFRANDDGEPSGSAGRPILGRIYSADLTNTLVAVVRYFGGTKLGVSGLINAYKLSAEEAIHNSKVIEKTICDRFRLSFDYEHMGQILNVLKSLNAEITTKDFGITPSVEIEIRKTESSDFIINFKANVLNVSTEQINEKTEISFCKITQI